MHPENLLPHPPVCISDSLVNYRCNSRSKTSSQTCNFPVKFSTCPRLAIRIVIILSREGNSQSFPKILFTFFPSVHAYKVLIVLSNFLTIPLSIRCNQIKHQRKLKVWCVLRAGIADGLLAEVEVDSCSCRQTNSFLRVKAISRRTFSLFFYPFRNESIFPVINNAQKLMKHLGASLKSFRKTSWTLIPSNLKNLRFASSDPPERPKKSWEINK